MASNPWSIEGPAPSFRHHTNLVELRTRKEIEFVDISDHVLGCVRRSGVVHGLVNVQTRHTTTAVVVNENEPGLLDDVADMLVRVAPRDARYRHDDLATRPTPVPVGERENGHAHLRSILLPSSVTLNVADGKLELGRWQRVFLLELDGAQRRTVSITVMGVSGRGAMEAPAVADFG
jgi:secondary thiamine-phosphate synthase enzyme